MKQFFDGRPIDDLYKALDNFKIFLATLEVSGDYKVIFDKIEDFWKREIGFFMFLASSTNLNIFNAYYRIRIDTGDINSQLIQEFGTPPINASTTFQRVNIPKFPVFYCSTSMDVAVFEALHRPELINTFFYLSKWSTTKDLTTITSHFLFKESIKSDLSNEAKNIKHYTSRIYNELTPDQELSTEQKKFTDAYIEFIANEFLNENNYALSSYVGHSNLYANHNIRSSIVFYPSIKKKHNGLNAAINPNFVTQHLRLEKVYHCKVVDNSGTDIKINFSMVGVPMDNRIIWSNISEKDLAEIRSEYSCTLPNAK